MVGLSVENEEGSCEVTEVSKLDGEASINNRKGKLIFFYEWNLKANWTGESQCACFNVDVLSKRLCLSLCTSHGRMMLMVIVTAIMKRNEWSLSLVYLCRCFQ